MDGNRSVQFFRSRRRVFTIRRLDPAQGRALRHHWLWWGHNLQCPWRAWMRNSVPVRSPELSIVASACSADESTGHGRDHGVILKITPLPLPPSSAVPNRFPEPSLVSPPVGSHPSALPVKRCRTAYCPLSVTR